MSKEEQPDREPLLSDDATMQWSRISAQTSKQRMAHPPHTNTSYALGAKAARDFYEAKITSGELLTRAEHERLLLQAIKDHESNQRGTW